MWRFEGNIFSLLLSTDSAVSPTAHLTLFLVIRVSRALAARAFTRDSSRILINLTPFNIANWLLEWRKSWMKWKQTTDLGWRWLSFVTKFKTKCCTQTLCGISHETSSPQLEACDSSGCWLAQPQDFLVQSIYFHFRFAFAKKNKKGFRLLDLKMTQFRQFCHMQF